MAKKISRPVIYTLLAAVVAGAVVFLTEPDPPVAHKKVKHTSVTVQTPDGFTDADYNAHFTRYAGGARDAFAAVVTPPKPVAIVKAPPKPNVSASKGEWELTGVNTIDGVASAVVENRSSGDVAFLKAGDTWRGLRVVQIATEFLVLENGIGQQTRLAFKTDAPEPAGPMTAAASAPGVPGAPPLPPGQPGAPSMLVPMPIQPLPGLTPDAAPSADTGGAAQFGGGRGRRRRQQN
ncbi:hypothetical protein CCAX7_36800 [Capsulimonas corticalis]|uniref:Uncharacterized protein n=1 Tax=Capsulimonas corticalis TaxID=2219043 RepID=A0A402D1C4_9BACT|nr:hypothetical protein [Capsulimonas corticalis]BDI31629.1 hypothetical protein CCAX7_36800 [Capsulimonas corticalis]